MTRGYDLEERRRPDSDGFLNAQAGNVVMLLRALNPDEPPTGIGAGYFSKNRVARLMRGAELQARNVD